MSDELFAWLLFAVLVGGVGWLLGIAAFFRAGRALREVAALRVALTQSPDRVSEQPVAAPALIEPPVVPATATQTGPELDGAPVPPSGLPPPTPQQPRRRDLEELVTARWGVWLGAAALLFAGVFLIRHAVEENWLGPAVRCTAMALLGFVLIGGWALTRRPATMLPYPDQVPAGLAAGGIVILFGGAYAASVLYALVPSSPQRAALSKRSDR